MGFLKDFEKRFLANTDDDWHLWAGLMIFAGIVLYLWVLTFGWQFLPDYYTNSQQHVEGL